jgi:D-serine deaminase-like pyridoxal phosphate-dependent protein
VYCDVTSLQQLPREYAYTPAAAVMTRVVSRPAPGIVTCDAGHKTVSADAGVPTCAVLGHPELEPLAPSEEHLPIRVNSGDGPQIGDTLFLIPRHVCPTVNNFDEAVIVQSGYALRLEAVSARGRERPIRL